MLNDRKAVEQLQDFETLFTEAKAQDDAMARIKEIDAMFERATHWGSWMVMVANEREALATKYGLPQKYQARTASGGRTS